MSEKLKVKICSKKCVKAESEFKMINSHKRMEYCLGNDFELLSVLMVFAVCQDFQSLTDTIIALVNYACIFKVK